MKMKRILVVDDELDVRDLLEITLNRGGHEIFKAATGKDAFEIALDKKPDLILMDVMMPGDMNGLDATRLLKADARTSRSKIIILTSSSSARDEAMNAGADVYLAKPFSPLELLQKIDELIDIDSVQELFANQT